MIGEQIAIKPATAVRNRSSQCGMALVITLVFLLLMTIVGVTTISTSTMDERIAGNLRNRNNAFEAAELALRYGEAVVVDPEKRKAANIVDGVAFNYFANEWDGAVTIEQTSSRTDTDADIDALQSDHEFAMMAEAPIFVIETDKGFEAPVGSAFAWSKERSAFYKISARGHGVNSPAVAVTQSRFLLLEREGDNQ